MSTVQMRLSGKMDKRCDAAYSDEGSIPAVGVLFDLTLVMGSTDPVSIRNCHLLVLFKVCGETFPEPVLILLVRQAEPSE